MKHKPRFDNKKGNFSSILTGKQHLMHQIHCFNVHLESSLFLEFFDFEGFLDFYLSCFQIHFSSVRDRNQPVMGRNQPDFLQANLVVECFWTKMDMFLYQIRRGVAKSIGIAVVGKAINVLLGPLQMTIMLIIGRNPIIMRICHIILTDLPNSLIQLHLNEPKNVKKRNFI